VTRPPGYLLRVQPGDLDLHRFQDLVDGAHQALRDGDPARAAAGLRDALGLWRGPALCDVDADALRWVEAPRLEELRLAALEMRIDAELRLGLHAHLVGELQALVAAHPVQERFAGQLMLALYRSGRQADALEVFTATRRRLIEDLGLEPGEDLQRLHRTILAGDAEQRHHGGTTDHTGLLSRPPGPLPRELPGPIAEFTGRTQELREITSLLEVTSRAVGQPVTISAVDGMGGIGKSALAVQAANQLAGQFPDGQLYIDLQGATPGQPPLTPFSRCRRPTISIRSSTSRRTVPTHRSATAFARGARRGVRRIRMSSESKTASKLSVNFASRSRIRNLNLTCLLRSPAP